MISMFGIDVLYGNQLIDIANSIDMMLLYVLSIISTNFNIIVDRMIGAAGHGNRY